MINGLMVEYVFEELEYGKTGNQRDQSGRGQIQPLTIPHLLKVLPPLRYHRYRDHAFNNAHLWGSTLKLYPNRSIYH